MWFYSKDKKSRIGPVPFEVLQQLARSGALRPGDMVQQVGFGTWIAAGSVPGLFTGIQPAPVPNASPSTGSITDKWNKLSSIAKAGTLAVVLLPLFCCTCAFPLAMIGNALDTKKEDKTVRVKSNPEPEVVQKRVDQPKKGVTRANYDRITDGMTLAEVQALLGPGKEFSSSGDLKVIRWEGGVVWRKVIAITFFENQVVAKAILD